MTNFTLPSKRLVAVDDSIIPNGNFTWAEATKNGRRLPLSLAVENSIILLAKELEEVRSFFGHVPITIHSWYRTPQVNRAVNGASNSRHLLGDAADISIQGISPSEVYKRLDSWWGDRGGLGKGETFTHLDLRGTRARWNYA